MTNSYRFVTIVAFFVTSLLAANILIVKQISVLGLTLPAAIIIFPIGYIFGDILTEVYGYRQARRVIWLGFFCNLLLVASIWLVGILPAAPTFEAQEAYDRILGNTPRFLIASFTAYLGGAFLNAYVLARMKVMTKGKWLWTRTIGSTLLGEGIDSIIVLVIGFWGVLPTGVLMGMILWHWLFKSVYEIIATPLTYLIVNYLKTKEKIDYYDIGTNFNPLRAN